MSRGVLRHTVVPRDVRAARESRLASPRGARSKSVVVVEIERNVLNGRRRTNDSPPRPPLTLQKITSYRVRDERLVAFIVSIRRPPAASVADDWTKAG